MFGAPAAAPALPYAAATLSGTADVVSSPCLRPNRTHRGTELLKKTHYFLINAIRSHATAVCSALDLSFHNARAVRQQDPPDARHARASIAGLEVREEDPAPWNASLHHARSTLSCGEPPRVRACPEAGPRTSPSHPPRDTACPSPWTPLPFLNLLFCILLSSINAPSAFVCMLDDDHDSVPEPTPGRVTDVCLHVTHVYESHPSTRTSRMSHGTRHIPHTRVSSVCRRVTTCNLAHVTPCVWITVPSAFHPLLKCIDVPHEWSSVVHLYYTRWCGWCEDSQAVTHASHTYMPFFRPTCC